MRKNLLLCLTDEEIIFYKGSSEKIYPFKEGVESIQQKLKNFLSLTPKTPLCLLIDRSHQDVREEELPPLLLWDKLRLLSHKREIWASQGGLYGYHFVKQEGKTYLQWVNISQNDSLIFWLSWIKSLSNPFKGIFFVSVEAVRLLTKHFPSSHGKEINYQMLIYKISSQKTRHVIFKGRRLLLSRPFQGEEDIRSSLHFLSRAFPDIHEKLHVLSLIGDISLTLPNVKTLTDPQVLTDFFSFQKQASLTLNFNKTSQNRWVIRGAGIFLISALCLGGITIYQGLHYKQEAHARVSQINVLKIQMHNHKFLLKNKDVAGLRSALEHYHYLKSQIKNPFKMLEGLSIALNRHDIRLESLIWNSEEKVDIEISFFTQNYVGHKLLGHFNALLSSFAEVFPNSHVYVIEGPFKSSHHETYKHPPDLAQPMAHVRILFP